MSRSLVYLSADDSIAELRVPLLLRWRFGGSVGLSGWLDLGFGTDGLHAFSRVSGVMDDFGTFVVTGVGP